MLGFWFPTFGGSGRLADQPADKKQPNWKGRHHPKEPNAQTNSWQIKANWHEEVSVSTGN